jgi:hypothetical protein
VLNCELEFELDQTCVNAPFKYFCNLGWNVVQEKRVPDGSVFINPDCVE